MKPTLESLLALLRRHPGEWLNHSVVYEAAGHRATARVMELRKMGHRITQRGRAENSQYCYDGGPPERTVANSYPRLICRCGRSGPEPIFLHFFNEVLCPDCGARVTGAVAV